MKILNGLSRQIIVSMSAVVLCVITLAVVGSYVFYSLLWAYWPPSEEDANTWMPSNIEWAWMGLITLVSLAVGAVVALKLSRRILMPLNSVAENLRKLADGDLEAQAVAGEHPIGEAAILVDDFNSMAQRLKRMAQEQAFWNAAIAHELRTPLTILRGRLQGLAEGVFEPDPFPGQTIQVGRQIQGLPVATAGVPPLLVAEDENDIRSLHRLRRPPIPLAYRFHPDRWIKADRGRARHRRHKC